ncbi:hypothetical protein, partial [Enterobacter mori]|uniref:hypothetical protein n=1 Tax=Enterobacter mori TaxID=539813 RepID=UPI00223750A8
GLANDQIAQSGLSSLSVIYYSAQLFSATRIFAFATDCRSSGCSVGVRELELPPLRPFIAIAVAILRL